MLRLLISFYLLFIGNVPMDCWYAFMLFTLLYIVFIRFDSFGICNSFYSWSMWSFMHCSQRFRCSAGSSEELLLTMPEEESELELWLLVKMMKSHLFKAPHLLHVLDLSSKPSAASSSTMLVFVSVWLSSCYNWLTSLIVSTVKSPSFLL